MLYKVSDEIVVEVRANHVDASLGERECVSLAVVI